MIEVTGLTKFYAGRPAVQDVSFQIRAGEIVGLLGLNGAGKSTILKILGSFLLPSAGRAVIGGFDVDSEPDSVRKIIGYLPDTPPLYDEMSVEAYLRFVARLKGVDAASVADRVQHVAERTNLLDVMDVALGELSHGFRQRVSIAQALIHRPKVLILDEPINGLDPVQIVEMRDLILSLRGDHTVILSSHILSEITRTADRILIIDQGRLVAEGREADLARGTTGAMRLTADVEKESGDIAAKVRLIGGVTGVTVAPTDGGRFRYTIATSQDVRAQVAEALVQTGAGLVSFGREEAGLEALFMKLIRSGQRDAAPAAEKIG